MSISADEAANGSSNKPAILYACIANWQNKQVLCQANTKADQNGSFAPIVEEAIVQKLEGPADGVPAIASEFKNYRFVHTSHETGYAVIHVCTKQPEFKMQTSLMFQADVAEQFEAGNYAPDSDCPGFKDTLAKKVHEYSTNPPKTKFDAVIAKQDQVKDQVIDNIEAVVKRHKEIEITLDQTESLKETSINFNNSSKQVRKTAQCKLYQQYAIFAGVAIVLLGILIIVICVSAKC